MNESTQTLLSFVIFFSLINKTYRDLVMLWIGIPELFNLIVVVSSEISFIVYAYRLMMLMLTLISATIIPSSMFHYFLIKKKCDFCPDFMYAMIRPQLYCALIAIFQYMLGLLATLITSLIQ